MTEFPRYAVYFAPDTDSSLWQFGSAVLGYDAASRVDPPFIMPPDFESPEWSALTQEPRQYGFHATLKAPFHLSQGHNEKALLERAGEIARQEIGFALDGLHVAALGSFIALVPVGDTSWLNAFALRFVEGFENFRAPLSPADRARRLKSPLNNDQLVNLDRYGYPYVGKEFRFHMTLTGLLHTEIMAKVLVALAARFQDSVAPGKLLIDRIAIFRQDAADERFHLLQSFALAPIRP